MQILPQTLAKLLFCVGLMITVVGCVIGSTLGSGTGGAPFFGVLLMILGGGLWQRFSRKACPACAERVNLQAAKCPNCAADLRA